jgi:hypothetical protein
MANLQRQDMGRAFLAPRMVSSARGPEDELWINLGWVIKSPGAQKCPEYSPLFTGAISQSEYTELMSRLKAEISQKGIAPEWVGISTMLIPCCCIGFLGCCVLQAVQQSLVESLDAIAKEKGMSVRMFQSQSSHSVEPVIDHFGQPLLVTMDAGSISQVGRPMWPPLGLNVVAKDRSGGQMRMAWPASVAGGMGVGMPMGSVIVGMPMMPMPQVEAQVITTTTVVSSEPLLTPMQMERGIESLADRLLKLGQLKEQGVLSPMEFETAKAAEIAKG